ncbi:MAG: FAD:protein FMN transferase [Clostridia bacterium]|nr:FAD:protein FMN transferase [Clostridia bacterium]
MKRFLRLVCVFLVPAFLFSACGGAEPYSVSGFAMGSAVGVKLWADADTDAQSAAYGILDAVNALDARISATKSTSLIYRLNAASVGVQANEDFIEFMLGIVRICAATGGALDVTTGTLTKLWDVESETPRVPSDEEIADALSFVDFTQLTLDAERGLVMKGEGQLVDLGAVGKGAACDAAYDVLARTSSSAVVDVGGSILLYGRNTKGSGAWPVGVRDPEGSANDLIGTLSLTVGDKSGACYVSTSGSYEKYFELDGKRYHHIMDPSTGRPADSGLRAVTVVSRISGLYADAFSTAFFIMGPDAVGSLLEAYELEAMFVTEDGRILLTDGLYDVFELAEGKEYTVERLA